MPSELPRAFKDGIAFDASAIRGFGDETLHNLKQVTVISTMNTPAEIYSDTFGNSIEGSLIKGTFNQIGIHDAEWLSLNMVKQAGDKTRTGWLESLEKKFSD